MNIPSSCNSPNEIIVLEISPKTGEMSSRCTTRQDLIDSTNNIAFESMSVLQKFPKFQIFQRYQQHRKTYFRPIHGTIDDYVNKVLELPSMTPFYNKKVIGFGGFGQVYQQEESPVATKVLINSSKIPELIIESIIPNKIREKCCVTETLRTGIEDGKAAINMRAAIGTMYDFKFPESELMEFFYVIVKGLYYAHSKGFYHRDLKQENILIFRESLWEEAEIGDWGLAGFMPYIHFPTGEGTPLFLPVEVMMPRRIGDNWFEHWRGGPEVDIFALGTMMYTSFTGIEPADTVPKNFSLNIPVDTQGLIASIYGDMSQEEAELLTQGKLYKPVILADAPGVNPEIMKLIRKMLDLRNRPSIIEVAADPIFENYTRYNTPPITAGSILRKYITPISNDPEIWKSDIDYFIELSESPRCFFLCLYYMNKLKSRELSGAYACILTHTPFEEKVDDTEMRGKDVEPFVALPFTFFESLNSNTLMEYLVAFEFSKYRDLNPYSVALAISKHTSVKMFEIPGYNEESPVDISSLVVINDEVKRIAAKLCDRADEGIAPYRPWMKESWWSKNYYDEN